MPFAVYKGPKGSSIRIGTKRFEPGTAVPVTPEDAQVYRHIRGIIIFDKVEGYDFYPKVEKKKKKEEPNEVKKND